jgi:uncharacterized protein (DUF849 family)
VAPAPLILAVAPNGARKTKADHPALPMTPREIAREAARSAEAGAAMIHLHVRDASGGHSLDPETYRDAIAAVRRETGDRLIVQVTSEAVGRYSAAEQMAMVRALKPEAVSLALKEILPEGAEEAPVAGFLAWVAREEILPQFILYDAAELARFGELVARGIIPDGPHFLLFVLGRYSKDQTSAPRDLLPFLQAREGADPWALCAFGRREVACAVTAAALDGHARVGFENNLYLPDGRLAPDNAALVAAVAEGARTIGRPLADAAEARAVLTARR